ncbi:MAG: T9SS type A sorting domain-containing protein [Bacteroidales bacterium]|nr:T9SS type A sorting domain-containing protein [Bacteroidales bacterium]
MKKSLLLALIVAMASHVAAQSHNPHQMLGLDYPYYYTNFDSLILDSILTVDHTVDGILVEQRYTDTSLRVYGIAVCSKPLDWLCENAIVLDTTTENWRSSAKLYVTDSLGNMILVAESPYNIFDEPKYLFSGLRVGCQDTFWAEMHEAYFEYPITISDTFWVGTLVKPLTPTCPDGIHTYYDEWPQEVNVITLFGGCTGELPQNPSPTQMRYIGGQWYKCEIYVTLLCYPILAPEPGRDTITNPYHYPSDDTTGVDTTGAAIYSPQLLERYTQLIPSVVEAGGTATVLSSFHLQAIELYDAAGRLVQSRPARGTAAEVDCTALPRGSYLVRLVTTAGTTTKKLTIR